MQLQHRPTFISEGKTRERGNMLFRRQEDILQRLAAFISLRNFSVK